MMTPGKFKDRQNLLFRSSGHDLHDIICKFITRITSLPFILPYTFLLFGKSEIYRDITFFLFLL